MLSELIKTQSNPANVDQGICYINIMLARHYGNMYVVLLISI